MRVVFGFSSDLHIECALCVSDLNVKNLCVGPYLGVLKRGTAPRYLSGEKRRVRGSEPLPHA